MAADADADAADGTMAADADADADADTDAEADPVLEEDPDLPLPLPLPLDPDWDSAGTDAGADAGTAADFGAGGVAGASPTSTVSFSSERARIGSWLSLSGVVLGVRTCRAESIRAVISTSSYRRSSYAPVQKARSWARSMVRR